MAVNETLIATVPALIPLFEKIHLIIASLQWLMGGLFGLYMILVILRWREARMVGKVLKEIREDLRQLADDIRSVNNKVEHHDHKPKKAKDL